VQKGLKVCILFEGRTGAGKGGSIKAMTEPVSPRIFWVVALPHQPSERSRRCTPNATFHICPRLGRS
jgi:polyphosphate kinase 2 (PPK2 family)